MSSISGYSSPVDLGLGQSPMTSNVEMFEELTKVYNAIHLLNQYLDQLRLVAEGGGSSSQSPGSSMPFNRFFTAVGLQAIQAGQVVCPTSEGQDGIVLGALAHDYASTAPTANFAGIALIDSALNGTSRVGVGPAILPMAGTIAGQLIWAYSSRATNGALFGNGNLFIGNPGPLTTGVGVSYPMPVATCVVDGYILFGQYLAR